MLRAVDLEPRFAFEYVEELARARVAVAQLGRSRRDALPDHAQVIVLEQVPAVAARAPDIVLGVVDSYRFCAHVHERSCSACGRRSSSAPSRRARSSASATPANT